MFHDQVNKTIAITHCREVNCFNKTLNYDLTLAQISKVIESSMECYQEVRFSCYSAKLTKHASWTDRRGKSHDYFTTRHVFTYVNGNNFWS